MALEGQVKCQRLIESGKMLHAVQFPVLQLPVSYPMGGECMPLPVLLKDVAEAMGGLNEELHACINRRTGEVVVISDEESRLAENGGIDDESLPAWQREILPKIKEVLESEDFVALPDQFEFNEYRLMQRFSLEQEDPEVREELLDSIRGRGAFRRFKDRVYEMGIEKAWFAYRDQALEQFAAGFLRREGIPFVEE